MLTIKQKTNRKRPSIFICLAGSMFAAGVYLLALVAAPSVAPFIAMKPIEVAALPKPRTTDNRIIIPKIGVNIPYGSGAAALDRGAEWRYPNNGNPASGGNFVIAAHRFSIQPTPQSTIEKSPFYHIDRLSVGDKIIVDYNGERYGYEINNIFDVQATQTEIEAPSTKAKLTLYSCELGGADTGRIVVAAKLLGKVKIDR
ncbi:class E sortase [Candidatus Southlakia epibionticum]|uniref:Class E sortase n=2 Tax=Candidatus Southlakia epibionticum TaxID=3043284 RepID=A0ABY8WX44_9BACT|nr:class E sortase [Candidatus Saccharimonadaceae bacterium ML1]